MAEAEQDKTEPATPHKRDEARRRGQVAKSPDANSFFVLAAALAAGELWGNQMIVEGARSFQTLLASAAAPSFDIAGMRLWATSLAREISTVLMPFFLLVVVSGVLSSLVQTGPVFSFHPLKPDMQRLNPVQGFKRIYSTKALFETFKSLLKMALFTVVSYTVITGLWPSIMAMTADHPKRYLPILLSQVESLAFKLILVLVLIALVDVVYVRWDYNKKMRMSRREQKEEVKRREGDPHIRAKRRELQREAAKRSSALRRVPDADVLITNPVHLAIALRYERGRSPAPRCVAKGAAEIAARMREIARLHGVTIIEQRTLARALFEEVDIDGLIPESLYEPVARVYAEAGRVRERARMLEVHT